MKLTKHSIHTVVFDADGTLFNSFELINEAYVHVAEVHGLEPPTPEQIRDKLRQALPIAEIFRSFYPDHDIQSLLHTNGEFGTKHALRVAAFEGLHDLLAELKARQLKMAILTGGSHKINDWLAAHNIDGYFASVVHSERTDHHKPHPGGFHLAVQECGASAEQAVMVGDSFNDILAGKNGGARATIGVTHGLGSREDLEQADADYLVDSLPEIVPILGSLADRGRI